MPKATTRLTEAIDVLDRLVEWLERFPEAGESSEFHRRIDGLYGRIERLVDELQPTERRNVVCEERSFLRRVS
jgi:hypothetical protein